MFDIVRVDIEVFWGTWIWEYNRVFLLEWKVNWLSRHNETDFDLRLSKRKLLGLHMLGWKRNYFDSDQVDHKLVVSALEIK